MRLHPHEQYRQDVGAYPQSGYTPCRCRDCFEIAVSNDVTSPDYCNACEGVCGPEHSPSLECQADTPADEWREVYAGVYHATCDRCRKSGNGWYWIKDGSHDNGTLCADCQG